VTSKLLELQKYFFSIANLVYAGLITIVLAIAWHFTSLQAGTMAVTIYTLSGFLDYIRDHKSNPFGIVSFLLYGLIAVSVFVIDRFISAYTIQEAIIGSATMTAMIVFYVFFVASKGNKNPKKSQ
jgi:uncharacterized membrane protein